MALFLKVWTSYNLWHGTAKSDVGDLLVTGLTLKNVKEIPSSPLYDKMSRRLGTRRTAWRHRCDLQVHETFLIYLGRDISVGNR